MCTAGFGRSRAGALAELSGRAYHWTQLSGHAQLSGCAYHWPGICFAGCGRICAGVLIVGLAWVQRAVDAVEWVCLPLAWHVFRTLRGQLSECSPLAWHVFRGRLPLAQHVFCGLLAQLSGCAYHCALAVGMACALQAADYHWEPGMCSAGFGRSRAGALAELSGRAYHWTQLSRYAYNQWPVLCSAGCGRS